jgi:hypothetical protein
MDPDTRGFLVPAALSVIVIAGLTMECSSESDTSGGSSDAGILDSDVLDSYRCAPWIIDGACPYRCDAWVADAPCPGYLVCVEAPTESGQCCECNVA